jgi:DNA-binding CsgD family transcriptional regulator
MGSKIDALTDREQEVLRLIGRGMSRAEIAKTLSRSPKTIDGHRERIMEKLDIHSSPELVRFAIREGLAEV